MQKHDKESGFITMLVVMAVILITIIIFAYSRVIQAQNT